MRQLLLDLQPESPPSLENFVIAPGNAEPLAALTRWLQHDDPAVPLPATCTGENLSCAAPQSTGFLLWGERGAGKTHLLFASGFVYLDAAADADLSALANTETPPCDLAVDHVERLSEAGQVALFNAYNRLRESDGRLLVAARQAPARLALREDLRTRLGWGLIYRLDPLSDAEKAAALTQLAAKRAMPLTEDAISYLLQHAPRDMRTLSDLVTALDRHALETKRPITLPLLRTLLRRELAFSLEP